VNYRKPHQDRTGFQRQKFLAKKPCAILFTVRRLTTFAHQSTV